MRNPIVPPPAERLALALDRGRGTPLAEQIRAGIQAAIAGGVLKPGARLPSWQDLAVQLGVARGTVHRAYSALADAHLVISSSTAGTRVVDRPPLPPPTSAPLGEAPLPEGYDYYGGPAAFRMGVPARDLFPATIFSRLHARAARIEAMAPDLYADPRGEEELRFQIAAHLAIARGIACTPAQVFVTNGFLGGLGTVLRVLGLREGDIWTEDPCFPVGWEALRLSGLRPTPVPVDDGGIVVEAGRRLAPSARAALVTPGQQAPLGMPLAIERRAALLEWARESGSWIIEDDYLGELQLHGRAAPALAAHDPDGRVVHIGSFSKTISPVTRLGFIVVPPPLLATFTAAIAYAGAAPGGAIQHAAAAFLRDGHYLRHLRRVKKALAASAELLRHELQRRGLTADLAGLAAIVRLPLDADDAAIARAATVAGMAPAPLSPWYASAGERQSGLLLGIASARGGGLEGRLDRLAAIVGDALPETRYPSTKDGAPVSIA